MDQHENEKLLEVTTLEQMQTCMSLPLGIPLCSHSKDLRKINQCELGPKHSHNKGLLSKGKEFTRA